MADYHPFHPSPRAPSEPPPAGTIDSQFHALGPVDKYPVRPGAAYEMPSATWEAAQRMHRALGITRGVIVQATTYGADHTVVLDALKALNAGCPADQPHYKACANAAVLSERDDAYLAELDAAGVRGARFTRAGLGISLSEADLQRALAKVKELGWYAKLQPDVQGIVEQIAPFEQLDIPVLIDHMARPDPAKGRDDPSLKKLLELLKRGNFWVMLSLGEKTDPAGPPWNASRDLARILIDAAPDRCVWGSDWPHPISKKPPPNDAELLELFYRYAPDAAMRKKILVDNPAQLFGFAK